MAYHGGGPSSHVYSGPHGPDMHNSYNSQYMNQGPPPPQPGMYQQHQQGHFNEYNGNNMHSGYEHQQGYFEQHQHGQMYDSGVGSVDHQHTGMAAPVMDSQQMPMMHTTNQLQMGRTESTKILRNPYPTVSKEIKQKGNNDMYDPNFPTGPPVGHGQFNQHRIAPPPPVISGSGVVPQTAPMYNNLPGMQPESNNMGMGNVEMYGNNMYGSNASHPQMQPISVTQAPTSNYQTFSAVPYGNSNSHNQNMPQEPPTNTGKMQIMTGVVTRIQPGAFGMVSEEIFFQENVVSGPLPRVGDKVVVEAEPVHGMPFKFNAKRVTRLDVDLVREEKNVVPPTQVVPQQTQPYNQQYQNSQTSHQYNNLHPAQQFIDQQNSKPPMHERESRFDPPNFGPLPSLPDSLNLPKAIPPPNLVSYLPSSSSSNSNQPLKSILKRKDRNPPPPPVISKNAGKEDVNPFRSSAPSSLKQNVFSVDLNKDIPTVLPLRGNGPPIQFPEYTFFNKEKPKEPPVQTAPASPRVTRLLPRSPIHGYGGGNQNSQENIRERGQDRQRSVSRDRGSPRRRRSRSRSTSPKTRSQHRSRSRSFSPRRSRRTRSRSLSPKSRRQFSVSPSPRGRRRSRSSSPGRSRRRSRSTSRGRRRSRSTSRGRRRSRSTSRNRRRSRSESPRSRRRISRSRSNSRDRQSYRVRRSSKSRSSSRSPYRTRHSFDARPSKSRSPSPRTSSGAKVFGETITHGIVVKRVCSDLFPRVVNRGPEIQEVEIVRRDVNKSYPVGKTAVPPAPIKFHIANAAKPIAPSSIVPNPTFKAASMAASTYLQNPAFNNLGVDAKLKKKKSKEQEPAFKIIEEKPKGDNTTTPVGNKPSVNIASTNNLLRNPVNVLHLKQTIQNDLQQLRSKGSDDTGKKLIENPASIQTLKQKVQRDLEELKTKTTQQQEGSLSGAKDKLVRETNTSVIDKNFDEKVEQRLKDLRSKFENHIKVAKATTTVGAQKSVATSKPAGPMASKAKVTEEPKVILVDDNLKDKTKPVPARQQPSTSSKGPTTRQTPNPVELPEYDEQMERLQEEIHKQRFMEEENRLKSVGDQSGLHQLYYMEDRRNRRMEERHLARIRLTEIKLKQQKNFGELAQLREEWGPPQLRLEQERELKQIRLNEEQQEKELHGQAEAIRKQEYDYQRWLEEEAAARSRNVQVSARANRGCEGRVLRRRTPSPSSRRNNNIPSSYPGPPPPEPRGPHPLRRGRSRSPSFERYKESWHRRHPRDRSPPMNYEEFAARYPIGPPPHSMPPEGFPPNHPDFHAHMPPRHLDQEGFFLSRAMDDVARRQDELMHREMEIQHRMEMAQRRFAGSPSSQHEGRGGGGREEIRRYAVPRR